MGLQGLQGLQGEASQENRASDGPLTKPTERVKRVRRRENRQHPATLEKGRPCGCGLPQGEPCLQPPLTFGGEDIENRQSAALSGCASVTNLPPPATFARLSGRAPPVYSAFRIFATSVRSTSEQLNSRDWNLLIAGGDILEARVGIEPTNKGFADLCLTTWLPRLRIGLHLQNTAPRTRKSIRGLARFARSGGSGARGGCRRVTR
jgi:hypothetical protein